MDSLNNYNGNARNKVFFVVLSAVLAREHDKTMLRSDLVLSTGGPGHASAGLKDVKRNPYLLPLGKQF